MMRSAYDARRAPVQQWHWMVWVLMALALLLAPVGDTFAGTGKMRTTKTVLVLGDSLSAAYGLRSDQGWVALLDKRLKAQRPGWSVVNASVSGETTAGGLSRLPRQLQRVRPAVVVIELGANDGLRGLPVARMQANLDSMVRMSQAAGAKVVVLGMRMPPNMGRAYTDSFANAYTKVARQRGTALVPFFLEPIMLTRAAFQGDNLHPTAAAQGRLLDHVWPTLQPLLK